jgi:hypothetical protein
MRTLFFRPIRAFAQSVLLVLGVVGPWPAAAVSVTSEERVAIVENLPAATGGTERITYLGLPFASAVLTGGAITEVQSDLLIDTTASWLDGQFEGANGAHYCEIISGAAAGWWANIVTTQATAHSLRLSQALPATVLAGDRFRVRRHFALGESTAGMAGGWLSGADPATADTLVVLDPATQAQTAIFRSDFPGYPGWFTAEYTPAEALRLAPQQGLIFRRSGADVATVAVGGVVWNGPRRLVIHPGFNLVSTARVGATFALSALGLYTGQTATGLAGGVDLASADHVVVPQPDGGTQTYFYSTLAGSTGWRDALGQPADAITVDGAAAFFIHRRTAGVFTWQIPAAP